MSLRCRAVPFVALFVPALLLGPDLVAQEARRADPLAETATKPKPVPAPVGHRQPRAEDVVGAGQDQKDDRIDQINRSLDRRLQICRNC